MRPPGSPFHARALLAPATLAVLLGLGLSGCGSSGSTPSSDQSVDPTSSASTSVATTVSPPDLPLPPTVKHPVGAVADIHWDASACGTKAGSQKVSGTVKNPTKQATDYVITINWVNATSDVLGRGVAVVKHARPGASTPWSLTGTVVDGATSCVPNVERGTVVSSTSGKKHGRSTR